mmetsp:Transcript_27664/g.80881  ORF Transcript_27664/g.80881 Transcript_27664/m.80881 type:complete len:254 (-) Transcript_27664:345-1106(-)
MWRTAELAITDPPDEVVPEGLVLQAVPPAPTVNHIRGLLSVPHHEPLWHLDGPQWMRERDVENHGLVPRAVLGVRSAQVLEDLVGHGDRQVVLVAKGVEGVHRLLAIEHLEVHCVPRVALDRYSVDHDASPGAKMIHSAATSGRRCRQLVRHLAVQVHGSAEPPHHQIIHCIRQLLALKHLYFVPLQRRHIHGIHAVPYTPPELVPEQKRTVPAAADRRLLAKSVPNSCHKVGRQAVEPAELPGLVSGFLALE